MYLGEDAAVFVDVSPLPLDSAGAVMQILGFRFHFNCAVTHDAPSTFLAGRYTFDQLTANHSKQVFPWLIFDTRDEARKALSGKGTRKRGDGWLICYKPVRIVVSIDYAPSSTEGDALVMAKTREGRLAYACGSVTGLCFASTPASRQAKQAQPQQDRGSRLRNDLQVAPSIPLPISEHRSSDWRGGENGRRHAGFIESDPHHLGEVEERVLNRPRDEAG